MLKIGKLTIQSNLILAPMAGVTDLPFRMLNRKRGCGLAYTEMINARSLGYNSKKTRHMLLTCDADRPLGVQLLACEPNFLLRALDILREYRFDLIDFNASCPVKKVVSRGEGAGLLRKPKKLINLLTLLVKNSHVPVTVKIRSGWDHNSLNAQEVARAACDAGASAVCIHARTRTQGLSGEVDYRIIQEIKKQISIPVLASGNILTARLAKKMFDETGCDAIMFARGALGNPWIFSQTRELMEQDITPLIPDTQAICMTMQEHLASMVDFYGSRIAVVLFRKFFSWYTKSFRSIRQFRAKVSRVKTHEEMSALIAELTHSKTTLSCA